MQRRIQTPVDHFGNNFIQERPLEISDDDFVCPKCNYSCTKFTRYERHCKDHLELKKYMCPFCSYATERRVLLREHVASHTGNTAFTCSFCPYTCIRKKDFFGHVRTHTGESPFECSYCAYKSKFRSGLNYHMKKNHLDMPRK